MVRIEDITDAMAALVLSKMEGINQSAYMEMVKEASDNMVYLKITDDVGKRTGRSAWSDGDLVMNEAFIASLLKGRPETDAILIDLGVLSFWDRIAHEVVRDGDK